MDIKSGGKSESVFDLNEGMWVEYETNTKSTTGSGLASGGSTLSRSKVTVEKK